MSTWCGNYLNHIGHVWAIEANPGEGGPDEFWCEGISTYRPPWWPKAEIQLGRRDTSNWEYRR